MAVPQTPIRWISCYSRVSLTEPRSPRRQAAADLTVHDTARNAERQRHRRPGRVSRRKPDQYRTREIGEQFGHHGFARVSSPDGSSQFGQLADHNGGRLREEAGLTRIACFPCRGDTAAPKPRREKGRTRSAARTRTAFQAMPAAASTCRPEACRSDRRVGAFRRRLPSARRLVLGSRGA